MILPHHGLFFWFPEVPFMWHAFQNRCSLSVEMVASTAQKASVRACVSSPSKVQFLIIYWVPWGLAQDSRVQVGVQPTAAVKSPQRNSTQAARESSQKKALGAMLLTFEGQQMDDVGTETTWSRKE